MVYNWLSKKILIYKYLVMVRNLLEKIIRNSGIIKGSTGHGPIKA
jgi:hypothetical protein